MRPNRIPPLFMVSPFRHSARCAKCPLIASKTVLLAFSHVAWRLLLENALDAPERQQNRFFSHVYQLVNIPRIPSHSPHPSNWGRTILCPSPSGKLLRFDRRDRSEFPHPCDQLGLKHATGKIKTQPHRTNSRPDSPSINDLRRIQRVHPCLTPRFRHDVSPTPTAYG